MLRPSLFLFASLLAAELPSAPADAPMPSRIDPMPIDAMAHGLRGRCYTVFEGDTVEPFEFVVKGVMHDYLGPKGDVVLVRLEGAKAEFTGVVAGMSGSPCFIGEKMVGALSYAFATFAKEPIAGITPIAQMQAVQKASSPALPWRLGQSGQRPAPSAEGGAERQNGDGMGLMPIATPVALGGCPDSVRHFFAADLHELGLGPVHNTARAHSTKTKPLRPGSPVAVVLMRGDMDMAATGTVTWVEDREVLAFGHPFMGSGPVSFPMAEASILNTMASLQRSFKMAATGPTVGELTQDRLSAIAGQLGGVPRMLPVSGTFDVDQQHHAFALEVARDLALTPRLVAMGLSSALTGRTEASSRGTVHVTGVLKSAGEAPLPLNVVVAQEHDDTLLSQAALGIARSLAAVWDTPFGLPDDTQLTIAARLDATPVEERVEAVLLDQVHVKAGERLDVGVRLRRKNHGLEMVNVPLTVPRNWAHQTIEIWAGGSSEADALAKEIEGQPHLASRADVVRALRARRAPGAVYVLAIRPGTVVAHPSEALRFLPPSAVTLLLEQPKAHFQGRGVAFEARSVRAGVVSGAARRAVHVAATP